MNNDSNNRCFLVLISGSVFFAAISKKKFDETLPFTFLGIVFILFFFGLFGQLLLGVYVAFSLAILLYIGTAVKLLFQKDRIRIYASRLFTPGFLFFCLLFLCLTFANFGKLASSWDEFSYWMDSVKVMTEINDFVANPASNSLFRSYPPAMGLFQFFIQQIYQMFNPGEFCEWLMYEAYQLFGLSLLFPFLSNLKWKQPGKNICVCLSIILIPVFLYGDFYTSIYIDPFVGLLAGAAFAYLFTKGFSTLYDALYIGLTSFTLILAKDIGKYFTVVLLIILMSVIIVGIVKKRRSHKGLPGKKGIILYLITAVSAGLAYGLWKIVLAKYNTPIRFGNKIDIVEYLRMFLFHTDTTYRQGVADRVRTVIFENQISLGQIGISVSYFALIILAGLAFVFLYRMKKRQNQTGADGNLYSAAALAGVFLQAVLYSIFIGAVYIANFSENEASSLASYTRYMNMSFLPLWIVALIGFIHTKESEENKRPNTTFFAVVLSIIFLISPIQNISSFLHKDSVRSSVEFRQSYEELATTIDRACQKNDKIYLISQGNNGKDYWVIKYRVRPNCIYLKKHWGWSIGESPLYDGDVYTLIMSADNFKQLLQEQYDYLAIYQLDSTFETTYGDLFTDHVQANSLYKLPV